MRSPRAFSFVAISCLVGLGLAVRFGCSAQQTEQDYFGALIDAIRADAESLHACVVALRSGSTCSQLDLLAGGRVRSVTMDENNNVYFILRDSFVTFNVGFVARQGESELLGDGQEPTIRHVEHLFENWWYYKAS